MIYFTSSEITINTLHFIMNKLSSENKLFNILFKLAQLVKSVLKLI